MNKSVLVALSGGIDSAAALYKLKNDGFEVRCITFMMWQHNGVNINKDEVDRAADICKKLDVPHESVNVYDEFKKSVVEYFVDEYFAGKTPNPCVRCNNTIKWKLLLSYADKYDFSYVSTGHYANIFKDKANSRYGIRKGKYEDKEQSYALWKLSQSALERTVLPLGDFAKEECRELVKSSGLITEQIPESQDICFIPDNDYRGFLCSYAPDRVRNIEKGKVVDDTGNLLGYHDGFYNFTVGQRKGLGISSGNRRYVKSVDADNNQVVLTDNEGLMSRGMFIEDVNWVSLPPYNNKVEGVVKIRYNHKGVECEMEPIEDGIWRALFQKPQRAVTPGQSAVLYQDEVLVLGGVIRESIF